MELVDVNLNLLVPLEALLRECSITAAAREIGLSQPATSHALARCRRLFGDELLHRVGRGYELTPRAMALREPLAEILARVRMTVSDPPAFDPSTTTRTFTVAATNPTLTVVGPLLLRLVLQRAPEARVRLLSQSTHDPDDLLRSPEVDIALVPNVFSTVHPRTRLYTDRWVLVADSRRDDITEPLTKDVLERLPAAVFEDSGVRLVPERDLEANGITRPVRLQYSDFLLAPMLVLDTPVIAVLQERLATLLARYLPLQIIELPVQTAKLGIDAVTNPAARHDPAVQWLSRTLEEATDGLRPPSEQDPDDGDSSSSV